MYFSFSYRVETSNRTPHNSKRNKVVDFNEATRDFAHNICTLVTPKESVKFKYKHTSHVMIKASQNPCNSTKTLHST